MWEACNLFTNDCHAPYQKIGSRMASGVDQRIGKQKIKTSRDLTFFFFTLKCKSIHPSVYHVVVEGGGDLSQSFNSVDLHVFFSVYTFMDYYVKRVEKNRRSRGGGGDIPEGPFVFLISFFFFFTWFTRTSPIAIVPNNQLLLFLFPRIGSLLLF